MNNETVDQRSTEDQPALYDTLEWRAMERRARKRIRAMRQPVERLEDRLSPIPTTMVATTRALDAMASGKLTFEGAAE